MQGDSNLSKPFLTALRDYKATYMAARNLAARTRREYETDILQLLGFLKYVGIRSLQEVAPKHIESFMADLDKRGLAGVTRRRKLTVIRSFLSWLKENRFISGNPASGMLPPQIEEKEPRVLSKEEYVRLLSHVQNPRDRAIIQLLLQTGIRLSEIARLTISDFEIPRRHTRNSLGTLRILGKGRRSRTVLLNAKACESLANWLQVRPAIADEALFVSSRKRKLSHRQYQYLVSKYLVKAGIRNASVHTLRHTFATHHIEMGTDLITVQEFLGHRSLDTTKLYVGLAKKRQAQHIQEHAL